MGKVRQDLCTINLTPRQDNKNGHIFEDDNYTRAVEGNLTDTYLANEANGFTFAGKGEWGSGTEDCTATFASRNARYVAVKVFSVGGDGNTITCGEFKQRQRPELRLMFLLLRVQLLSHSRLLLIQPMK